MAHLLKPVQQEHMPLRKDTTNVDPAQLALTLQEVLSDALIAQKAFTQLKREPLNVMLAQ